MNATELIEPPPPQSAGHYRSAIPNAPTFDFEPQTAGAVLDEVLPLIGVVAMAGPPVVFVVVPWVLFALMLVGPFLLLVTFVLAGVILFALAVAILSPPYLLVRYLRTRWTRQPNPRPLARRLRGPHPTGFRRLSLRRGAGITNGPTAQPLPAAHLHNHTPTHLTSEGI
jgi:hypothetical protein